MTNLTIARHQASAYQPAGVAFAALKVLRGRFAVWLERRRGRAALLSLDDAGLKDIGISRAQAHFESDKPFWCD